MVSGQVSHELEVMAPANKVWEIYGTLRLAKLVEENLKTVIENIDVVEGDGGVGTVLNLHFVPGVAKYKSYKEKYTKVDDEKRVKEAEVVEGGYLDFGFTLYRVRFEMIEKDEGSSIIKSTIEYELKEDSAENISLVSLDPLAAIALIAQNQLPIS
ncbi:norbelladine synthase-like [Humulus lupulus]|uniref:norbelladine synthase-like n=1 Tax=Humulus lupulus TaxID=3486 RepID=UPI002B400DD8|nr:norbelladine synthase-like [Humulus lupulus]